LKIIKIKNWNYLFILTILFAVLTSGCKKDFEKIGLGLQPEQDNLKVQFCDTTTVIAYSVLVDSVNTSGLTSNLLGSIMDPVFGLSTASIYTQFKLTTAAPDFGENPVLDSLILCLSTDEAYGDTTTQQTIRIFELDESMSFDTAYYSNYEIPNTGVELANHTYFPEPNTSVIVGEDTLDPHINIKMSDFSTELGEKILNADSTNLSSNTDFVEFFKGFYITVDDVTEGGAIVFYKLTSAVTRMKLYYQNDENDSLSYELLVSTYSARFNHYEHNSYLDASPEFQEQVINGDTSLGESLLYLQPMSGVKTKIIFPYLQNWLDSGSIFINQARLWLKPAETETEYDLPTTLALIKINEEGEGEFIIDQYEGESYFGGNYDSTYSGYNFRISRHIQKQLSDNAEKNELNLLVSGGSTKVNRLLISGTEPSEPIPYSDRLKLELIYTRIN